LLMVEGRLEGSNRGDGTANATGRERRWVSWRSCGSRRLRGREHMQKRYLAHVSVTNLPLAIRFLLGARTPRELPARPPPAGVSRPYHRRSPSSFSPTPILRWSINPQYAGAYHRGREGAMKKRRTGGRLSDSATAVGLIAIVRVVYRVSADRLALTEAGLGAMRPQTPGAAGRQWRGVQPPALDGL
jgi:hypothetical protein